MPLLLPLLAGLLALTGVAVSVQEKCAGELTQSVNGDVHVTDGATCYLRGNVTISGSVFLTKGASLETSGTVVILGGSGILGMHAGNVKIGGNLTVTNIDLFNGTSVEVRGATVLGELKVEGSLGGLRVCNTRVADVVEYKENAGDFYAVADWWALKGWWGCGPNKFERDVKVEMSEGDVRIVGNNVNPGELSIKGVIGYVTVKNAKVFKMKIEANKGPVYFQNVRGAEGEIKDNAAGVALWGNKMDKLKCVGNWPGVRGGNNDFETPEGQCETADIEVDD